MVQVKPLPKMSSNGECPWCRSSLCDGTYEDEDNSLFCNVDMMVEELLPQAVENLITSNECPNCHKPISVDVTEHVTVTCDIYIKACRSKTDLKYMESMGLSEPSP